MMRFHGASAIAVVVITSALILVGNDALAGAYLRFVHFDVTQYLARAAGFDENDARGIAQADQGIDDDPRTDPRILLSAREKYHFTTVAQRNLLRQEAFSSCAVSSLGAYLHAFEDAPAHEGFGPEIGHLLDPVRPDQAFRNVAKALIMVEAKYEEIKQYKLKCRPDLKATPRPWQDFSARIRDYLAKENPGILAYP